VKASVFIATSLDGFIARTNGDLDWLPPGGGEPHGYDEFMATVDALVIGRKTFDTVLTFDTWPYGAKPVFVLSTRPLAPAPRGAVVERMSGLRRTSCHALAHAASGTSMWMAGSPFNGFSKWGSSSASLSPAFPCSWAMESRSLAPSSATSS
jgi:dihydrofolate reductase